MSKPSRTTHHLSTVTTSHVMHLSGVQNTLSQHAMPRVSFPKTSATLSKRPLSQRAFKNEVNLHYGIPGVPPKHPIPTTHVLSLPVHKTPHQKPTCRLSHREQTKAEYLMPSQPPSNHMLHQAYVRSFRRPPKYAHQEKMCRLAPRDTNTDMDAPCRLQPSPSSKLPPLNSMSGAPAAPKKQHSKPMCRRAIKLHLYFVMGLSASPDTPSPPSHPSPRNQETPPPQPHVLCAVAVLAKKGGTG